MLKKIENIKNLFGITTQTTDSVLKELIEAAQGLILRSNTSVESKDLLDIMKKEIKDIEKESNQTFKNEKIARLLIGCIIWIFAFEDCKYHYSGENRLYPGKSLIELQKKYQDENPNKNLEQSKDEQPLVQGFIVGKQGIIMSKETKANKTSEDINFMNWLGTQALFGQIPFSSDDLERKILTANAEIPSAIFRELAGKSKKINWILSLVRPVITRQLLPKYVSAFKEGAAIGFFSNPAFKQPLLIDISKYIAKNFLNKQDAYNMTAATKQARILAIKERQEKIEEDTAKDKSSSKDKSSASCITM